MAWSVLLHPDFDSEIEALDLAVRDKLAEIILALEQAGPRLGRPWVGSVHGSRHANMKEARVQVRGAWRFFFAFDPKRNAVILCGANKEGGSARKFYRTQIAIADRRFDDWLAGED